MRYLTILELMPNFLIHTVGLSLIMASLLMIPSIITDYLTDYPIQSFSLPCIISLILGITLTYFSSSKKHINMDRTISSSIFALLAFTVIASLPFRMHNINLSFTDSFFEAMSGITTTGATVLYNLDTFPKSILLWRSLLHAVGGIGIIIFSLIFLQVLEVSDNKNKCNKAMFQTFYIYFTLIIMCTISFWIGSMSLFDAFCHACSTIATAGFANYDSSFAYFNNVSIEIITTVFLLLSALPFTSYIQFVKNKKFSYFATEQILYFFISYIVASLILSYSFYNQLDNIFQSIRYAFFIIASMITTTGFAIIDFEAWNISTVQIIILITMFIGGCTGSSAGGLKSLRLLVLLKTLKKHISQTALTSNKPITIDGKVINHNFIFSISAFFFIYIVMFVILALLISLTGLDFLTCISAAASSLTNSGPGLGATIGPAGNYASFPIFAKWIYIIGMFLGRLEIIMVITLFAIIGQNKENQFD